MCFFRHRNCSLVFGDHSSTFRKLRNKYRLSPPECASNSEVKLSVRNKIHNQEFINPSDVDEDEENNNNDNPNDSDDPSDSDVSNDPGGSDNSDDADNGEPPTKKATFANSLLPFQSNIMSGKQSSMIPIHSNNEDEYEDEDDVDNPNDSNDDDKGEPPTKKTPFAESPPSFQLNIIIEGEKQQKAKNLLPFETQVVKLRRLLMQQANKPSKLLTDQTRLKTILIEAINQALCNENIIIDDDDV